MSPHQDAACHYATHTDCWLPACTCPQSCPCRQGQRCALPQAVAP